MFKLSDNFISYNQNKQPYTLSVERHTETANLHAGVTKKGFALKSVGNRFVLNTPRVKNAVFEMNFAISYLQETNPYFYIIFGYDKAKRIGRAVEIAYDIGEKKLLTALVSVNNGIYAPLCDKQSFDFKLGECEYAKLTLEVKDNLVRLNINETESVFECKNICGAFAIDRNAFIGELIISDFSFVSDDVFDKECIIKATSVNIPLTNGGDLPYKVTYSIDKTDGEYYMTAMLEGGTQSRKFCKNERNGQYVAEVDYMDTPYVGIFDGKNESLFSLARGELCFVDPNIFWECQKDFFGNTQLPIKMQCKLQHFVPTDKVEFVFGYKDLFCRGYAQQRGGCEFRFSADGSLTYSGGALNGDDSYELLSPPDKKAVSLVSKSAPEYEGIISHLKSNHYFSADEKISFCLCWRTRKKTEYLTFKAEIKDVFEAEVLAEVKIKALSAPFRSNYNEIKCEAKFKPLAVGVYKIVFTVLYGDTSLKTISHAFEVYDENEKACPPLASGLPFMFTMNNEQKKLARNGFDLLTPMPSCDFGHYIACATTTPVEAEKQRIWENLKIFGRPWFAWLAIRTCDDYLSHVHNETIKNADFLFHSGINTDCDPLGVYGIYPCRVDHWERRSYNFPEPKKFVESFFAENPQYLNEVSYEPGCKEITEKVYNEIIEKCGDVFIDYVNGLKHKYVKEHNRELEKINPKVKRSIYGPFPPYFSPTTTHHSLKYFGMPENDDLTDEYFNGFAIFEDYPFSCSYQPYRGAFAVMTLLLWHPKLKLYPELYSGSRGGCIDGAVKYAHAPMGEYNCLPYQSSQQVFEYVFNTAHKTNDGFKYWTSYGFHRGVESCEYMNEFVKNWHFALKYKPAKPMRSAAYIADFGGDKDIFRKECNFYNQSESGQTVVYECSREAGLPCGFGIKPQNLEALNANECDVLVIPSLAKADKKYISEIRRLYAQGVNLVALSDIGGLEDIFGVKRLERTETVQSVEYNGEVEYVYNTEACFAYAPTSATACVTANENLPVCICTERTLLINTALFSLGCADKSKMCAANGAFIVGRLIRKAICDKLVTLSSPPVFGENVGTTFFEDENGRRVLLAMNYTPFDNREEKPIKAVVKINLNDVSKVKSDIPVMSAKKDGFVSEIMFDINPHGFAFIELE